MRVSFGSLTVLCVLLLMGCSDEKNCPISSDGNTCSICPDFQVKQNGASDSIIRDASNSDALPTCDDKIKNGNETDIDCGGNCSPCKEGKGCQANSDCQSNVCAYGVVCLEPACFDGIKNGSETDVDCGGSCTGCDDTKACKKGPDCSSGVCEGEKCAEPTCKDKVKNGSETDVDCGGSCPACEDTKSCKLPSDCSSGVCTNKTCAKPACDDKIMNGDETDIDCGGSCTGCEFGKQCETGEDCSSHICTNKKCAWPHDCGELKTTNQNLSSGIYTVDPNGQYADDAFDVYCDMSSDGGGWTLVHKLCKDIQKPVVSIWTGENTLNEDQASFLDLQANADHYLNRFVTQYWNKNGYTITDVRVALYSSAAEKAFLIFDGASSTNTNWFTKAKLKSATWTDIATQSQNFFSISGDGNIRNWFINRNYGGCSADSGWLVVTQNTPGCAWESAHAPINSILYSTSTTYQNWTTGQVAEADVLAVFIR